MNVKNWDKNFIGHSSSNIKKATLIVKSSAVNNSNKEIKEAKEENYQFLKSRNVSKYYFT